MEINFVDKVAIVTGASSGIGEATAILFAKYGAKLALVATNEGKLQNVASRCEKEKENKPLVIIADLSTDEGCERTVKDTLKHFRRVDVLVNSAGIGAVATIENTDMAVFDRVFNLDVRGVYNLTRLLVPALIETKGNIVNISSIGAETVAVGCLPYGMAKSALNHFTRLVALELAPKGVRVNTINPGVTISNFIQRITGISDLKYEQWIKNVEELIPLGQACTGEDIAKMVLHLASDNCGLVTGTDIPVDGGLRFGDMNVVLGSMPRNE